MQAKKGLCIAQAFKTTGVPIDRFSQQVRREFLLGYRDTH